MASKIITLRLPRSTYDALSSAAAVAGLPLSVYVRSKIERAELAAVVEALLAEVRNATTASSVTKATPSREREILLLVRTVAAHLNPQIPQAVAAKLRAEAEARK